MSVTVTNLISGLSDVRDLLRIVLTLNKNGVFKLSSNSLNALLFVSDGYVTDARILNDNTNGVLALERILKLKNPACEFLSERQAHLRSQNALRVDIKLVLSLNLSLEGVPTDPLCTGVESIGASDYPLPPGNQTIPRPVHTSKAGSMLSPEQTELLEEMQKLSDSETFIESSSVIEAQQRRLDEYKRNLLLTANFDDKDFQSHPFDAAEIDGGSLTEAQLELLEEVKKLGDLPAFLDPAVRVNVPGLAVSAQDLIGLLRAARELPPEEQLRQFQLINAELESHGFELRDFIDYVSSSALSFDTEALDAIQAAKTLAGDSRSLTSKEEAASAVPSKRSVRENFGDLLRGKLATYDGPRPARHLIDTVFSAIIFVSLCGMLIAVPVWIKANEYANEQRLLSDNEARILIDDAVGVDVPYVTEYAEGFGRNAQSAPLPNVRTSDEELKKALVLARSYAGKGWTKRAAAAYRGYLDAKPDDFEAWLELIKLFVGAGDMPSARQACLDALKQDSVPAQYKAQLWEILNASL